MQNLATKNGYPDSKIKHIFKWIDENMKENNGWNNKRLIIFTEWEDTLRYIKDQIESKYEDSENILKILEGPPQKRKERK